MACVCLLNGLQKHWTAQLCDVLQGEQGQLELLHTQLPETACIRGCLYSMKHTRVLKLHTSVQNSSDMNETSKRVAFSRTVFTLLTLKRRESRLTLDDPSHSLYSDQNVMEASGWEYFDIHPNNHLAHPSNRLRHKCGMFCTHMSHRIQILVDFICVCT